MTTYERRGGDVLANTTTAANQDGGQVVFLSDGRFVIVWRDSSATGGDTSGTAVRGQIFNADGSRSGGEFLVNTSTAGSQNSPALFALPSGGFVVAWTDALLDGTDAEVRAQMFDLAGAKSGAEILVNTHLSGVQSGPSGAALAGGGFVLTWTDATAEPEVAGTGGSRIGVRSQLFDATGAKFGPETAVNVSSRYEQSNPSVAALAGGGYVVAWQDVNSGGIMGRRYADNGSPIGGEFLISTVLTDSQIDASVAGLAGGGFVVTWTDYSGIGGDTHYTGIKAQIYDAAGAKVGGEFLANSDTQGYQRYSFVTGTDSGGFLVMWSNTTSTVSDGSGSGVKAQYFSATGVREGGEFWINSTKLNDQFGSGIAVGADSVIAVYADLSGTGGDSSGSSVKFERFVLAPGTDGDDVLTGTDGEDAIHGFDGNDLIDGAGSADELFGEGGDDVLIGGEGDDDLYGAEGADTLTGDVGNDLLDGGDGDDELSGGESDDELFAGEGIDSLAGGGGSDVLNGDGGDDTIDGGEGDDGLAGGDGDDILVAGAGADLLIGGNGDDELDGGEGDDDIYYQYLGASPDHDIAAGGLGIDALFVDLAGIAGGAGVTMTIGADADGGDSGLIAAGADYSVAFSSIEIFFISTTAAADRIETGGGNDLILAQGGDDVIVAGGGNDYIVGGTGADSMTGGQGDDRYDVDDAGDTVVENAGEGTDEVQSRLAVYTLGDTLENLTGLLATGQTLTGNGGVNVIKGHNGNDVIDGGAGADTMQGGAGNDLYHVDNAGDLVSDTAGTDEIRTGLATYSLAGLAFIENLTGTNDAGMTLTGNDSANVIRGAEGADLIRGGIGNDQIFGGGADDRLDGGEGADTMTGGAGNDVYDVDAYGDVIVEAADGGIDEAMVAGGVVFTLGANVENATAVGGAWHTLIGNSLANVLRGSTGVDELDGRGGDDTMIGGQGWDYYYVDSLGDVIVEEEDVWPVTPGGDTVITSLAEYTLGPDLENLRGDSSQQRLVGNDKGNYLSSEGGSDTLIGGKGNDEYGVFAGDVIVELEGEGVDTVIVRGGNWTLSDTLENLTGTSSSGQSLTGNQFANRISGANGNDTIDGGGGADIMVGEGGNDIYYVDEAGDVVTETFNEGIDEVRTALAVYTLGAHVENFRGLSAAGQLVHGNSLSNTMIGGEGSDLFRVESGGADVVRGNGGQDIIVFGAGLTALDQADGGLGSDALFLQGNYNLTFTATMVVGIENLVLMSHTDSTFGQAAASPFAYRFTSVDSTVAAGATMTVDARWLASTETLNFSGAAETNGSFILIGGKGADTLTGGAGADFVDGDAGNDVMAGGKGDDVYLVSESGDQVTELANEGTDEIRTGLATYTLGANVEKLTGLWSVGQTLTGNGLANTIAGAEGNDTLAGGAGGDMLYGGEGHDTLYSASISPAFTHPYYYLEPVSFPLLDTGSETDVLNGGAGNDTIFAGYGDTVEGGEGFDSLYISFKGAQFGVTADFRPLGFGLSGSATIGGVTISGIEVVAWVEGSEFADFIAKPDTGTAHHPVYGRGGDDTIIGGNDGGNIYGGDGNDTIDNTGSAYGGYLYGDAGDDVITDAYGNFLSGGDGADRLYGGLGFDQAYGGGGNDIVDGGTENDSLFGEAGNDTLYGNGDNDTLEGGDGDDSLYGDYSPTGTQNAYVQPNQNHDKLFGGAGADSLYGNEGGDWLDGGTGADFMAGGSGDDIYWVDSAGDQVVEANGQGTDEVRTMLASYTLGANLENLSGDLLAGQSLTGNGAGNIISATSGNDILDGGAGADLLKGGFGNDVYIVDDAGDQIEENGGAGTDEVRTSLATFSLGFGLENLTGTRITAQTLRGNSIDNVVGTEVGAATFLLQDGGADVAHGATNNDVFYFGAAFGAGDRVYGSTGNDEVVLQGAYGPLTLAPETMEGIQTLTLLSAGANRFGAATAGAYSYDITIPAGFTTAILPGLGLFPGEEGELVVDASGLAAGETLHFDGSAASPTAAFLSVRGGAGADHLLGGAGGDDLRGGGGDDLLEGGGGNDYLDDVGGGSNVMRGGEGDDVINFDCEGAATWSTLGIEGGNGNDWAMFYAGSSGAATIDMGAGNDRVDIRHLAGGSARVTLGTGQDTLSIAAVPYGDAGLGALSVTDFQAGAGGDRFEWPADMASVFFGWTTGSNPFADGYARLVQNGADTLLQISRGASGSFTTLVRFENRQATDFTGDNFQGWSPLPVTGGAGADQLSGTSSSDFISGGDGNDFIFLQHGGDDRASGGDGKDVFLLGGALTPADRIDGGAGIDQIALQGDYSGAKALLLGANIVSVENIAILPGNDTRFGDPGTNFYDLEIATTDAAVAAGVQLVVDANRLRPGEDFTFNGSAETDGSFFIYGGGGTDILTGGARNDVFIFGGQNQWGASDVVTGGAGIDQLALRGNYTIVFGAGQLIGVEQIAMVSAQDTRYGALGSSYNYNLTLVDANVDGIQMTIDAAPLRPGETLTFNGSAEDDGSFRVFAGRGNDTIVGSQNGDLIQGNLGMDFLTGGGGADTFRYFAGDSVVGSADHILDFTPGTDRIDLSRIDADTHADGNQAFRWIGSNAFGASGPASAGELRAWQDNGGSWFVEGDTDGDGAADLLIQLTLVGPVPLGADAFLL